MLAEVGERLRDQAIDCGSTPKGAARALGGARAHGEESRQQTGRDPATGVLGLTKHASKGSAYQGIAKCAECDEEDSRANSLVRKVYAQAQLLLDGDDEALNGFAHGFEVRQVDG